MRRNKARRTIDGWRAAGWVAALVALALIVGGCRRRDSDRDADTVASEGSATSSAAGKAPRSKSLSPEMVTRIARGDVSLRALNEVLASNHCVKIPRMAAHVRELSQYVDYRMKFAQELADEYKDLDSPGEAYAEWLLSLHEYLDLCHKRVDLTPLTEGATAVREKRVERAIKSQDCVALIGAQRYDLWPFEARFARELMDRDFSSADVTRAMWIDAIDDVRTKCADKLTPREATRAKLAALKLRRIIGLDDAILVGLRTKLLDAVEADDAEAVLNYSRAIAEREVVLDSLNAGEHEARLASMEEKLEENLSVMREAMEASSATAATSGPAGPSTAQQVGQTMDNVRKGAEATQAVMGLFGF